MRGKNSLLFWYLFCLFILISLPVSQYMESDFLCLFLVFVYYFIFLLASCQWELRFHSIWPYRLAIQQKRDPSFLSTWLDKEYDPTSCQNPLRQELLRASETGKAKALQASVISQLVLNDQATDRQGRFRQKGTPKIWKYLRGIPRWHLGPKHVTRC